VSGARHRAGFREQLAEAGADDPVLAILAESFVPAHETLCRAAAAVETQLHAIGRQIPLARRLMTVPGVGTMVALSFIATIDDTGRFRRASDVGAFLGLTPRRYQSGETDYSGRISKCGDASMRTLLFEAAACLIRQVRRFSPLKAWAVRLAARKGFKKAAVATARKIAVILHCIWRDGTEFHWTKEASA
jgi:transposase